MEVMIWSDVGAMPSKVVVGANPENIYSLRAFRILTHGSRERSNGAPAQSSQVIGPSAGRAGYYGLQVNVSTET